MSEQSQKIYSLIDLTSSFRKTFIEVCEKGYSVLGRTPAAAQDNFNPWQYGSGHPPSYSALGRYRFLKTLQLVQSIKPEPKSILEVAAGGGFNGACLYEPGRRVVLNDMRFLGDEVDKWLTGSNLETVTGNLFDLKPESLGQFDLVMACEVIEHVAYGDQLINHLKQFLAPKGTLLLTTPNGLYFRSKLPTYSQITDFSIFESEQFKPDADGHLYLYAPQEIYGILQKSGFKKITIDLSITPFLSGHMGLRFLPSFKLLTPTYFTLDRLTQKLAINTRSKLCVEMMVIAQIE